MTLVGEASLYRRLGGGLTVGQELLHKANAPLNKVGMGCCTNFTGEAAQQLEAAHTRQCSQLDQRDSGFRSRIQALDRLCYAGGRAFRRGSSSSMLLPQEVDQEAKQVFLSGKAV